MAATTRAITLNDVPNEVALAVQPVIRHWELAALNVASGRAHSFKAGSAEAILDRQLSGRPRLIQAVAATRAHEILTDSRFPSRAREALGKDATDHEALPDLVSSSFTFPARLVTDLQAIAGQMAAAHPPADEQSQTTFDKVVLGIRSLACIDETNGFLGSEAGGDEISIGGTWVDSDQRTGAINAVNLGSNWDDGDVKRFRPPTDLLGYSLRGGLPFPRAVFVTLVLAERDGAGDFQTFIDAATDKIAEQAKTALAAALGAAVGSAGGPVGTLIGLAVGYAIGKIVDSIKNSWADDLFTPVTVELQLPSRQTMFRSGKKESLTVPILFTGPGEYRAHYQWRLIDKG
jgi:hypothetical protein